jgi:hypothetical protein
MKDNEEKLKEDLENKNNELKQKVKELRKESKIKEAQTNELIIKLKESETEKNEDTEEHKRFQRNYKKMIEENQKRAERKKQYRKELRKERKLEKENQKEIIKMTFIECEKNLPDGIAIVIKIAEKAAVAPALSTSEHLSEPDKHGKNSENVETREEETTSENTNKKVCEETKDKDRQCRTTPKKVREHNHHPGGSHL